MAAGLPSQLVNFTSPIVETALKTGARGKTVTTTNYGVIGDAMFKKAQLDLGIANLKADMGFRQAEMQADLAFKHASLNAGLATDTARINSGLAMHQADMAQDMAKTMIDQNLRLRQMKMEIEANEVGFFEALLNDVAGGVMGAATGFMVGGPVGAVVGGAAGFGMTAMSQVESGRRGAQGARSALQNISQGAALLKGGIDAKKGEDAWKTWSDRAQFLANVLNDPGTQGEGRIQAQRDFDAHINSGLGVMTQDLKVNPQQAAKTMGDLRQLYMAPQTMASDRAKDFAASSMQTAFEAKADPRLDDPAQANEALTDYIAKFTKNYAVANGGKEIPNDVLDAMLVESGISKRKGIMSMTGDEPAAPSMEAQSSDDYSVLPQQQVTPGDMASGAGIKRRRGGGVSSGAGVREPDRDQIRQAPPAYSAPVKESPGRAWHPPMAAGPGLVMDDGQPPITSPEAVQGLSKLGAESAKILAEQDEARKQNVKKTGPAGWLADKAGLDFDVKDRPDGGQRGAEMDNVRVREDGLIDRIRDAPGQALEDVKGAVGKAAGWVGDGLKKLDQAVTPGKITRQLEKGTPISEGKPHEVDLPKRSKEELDVVANESKAYWDKRIAAEPAKNPKQKAENQAWFRSKDPEEIQSAMGIDKKDAKTMEERDRLASIAAVPAIMNDVRDKALEFSKKLPGDEESRRELAEQYMMWKFGEGGPGGDMAMKGQGGGATVAGTGMSIHKFERKFSQQLEKMGVKPGSREAKEIWMTFKELDATLDPLAGTLAKANLGGQLSDKDLAMHTVKNALDPDPDIMISGLMQQQRDLLKRARSILNIWDSKETVRRDKMMEARAGRQTPEEAFEVSQARSLGTQAGKAEAKSFEEKSYFETLRDATRKRKRRVGAR